ncbi:MAG: NAD+ synthase [Solirubrobacteraceae bacterium]
MRLALCQLDATVGDIAGNSERIAAGIEAARAQGAQLALFPELALTGYPPEDLLLREHFLADSAAALRRLADGAQGIVAVVGFPERAEDVYNAAAVLAEGRVHAVYRKVFLPNYGVFDEQRYFQHGQRGAVIELGAEQIGLTVCEDIWEPGPPASEEAHAGAALILNISASPYHAGKGAERERMLQQRARENLACVAFCALTGGQDELIFDGHSCVIDHTGRTIARAAQFREELLLCDIDLGAASAARLRDPSHRPAARRSPQAAELLPAVPGLGVAAAGPAAGRQPLEPRLAQPLEPRESEVYEALLLGLRDYVEKNGFAHVVLGLSGGIDSALVACLAVDALGSERVTLTIMPSPFSSAGTQQDARELAAALGASVHELPIAAPMQAYEDSLAEAFAGREPDLAEENLQARIRGNLLMALSNKFGWLVLTTGNKSEMSVGYSTLYGDLAGGFAVIKDVPKTLVYRLAEWRNSPAGSHRPPEPPQRAPWPAPVAAPAPAPAPAPGAAPAPNQGGATPQRVGAPIPRSIIERPPSAELRPDQRDDDSLPPYEVLDRILEGYVELDLSSEQLIAQGLPADAVERTVRLVDLAEYKRRQAPPGIKITTRAFGRDRRMPITNGYRG